MKTVCVVTGSRAEFGLLLPVIRRIHDDPELQLQLCVTGMHLSPEFGYTYSDVEASGMPIHEAIPVLLGGDDPASIAKSTGLTMISFADYFTRSRPDMLLVLGDRFEIFAVAAAASLQKIPIAHLYGGETTIGATDEFLRHSITKMSYVHFTATQSYSNRVINMGEAPDRVFTVGSLGIENAKTIPLLTKKELYMQFDIPESKSFIAVSYHPVTLDNYAINDSTNELFDALASEERYIIFTKANADAGGRYINEKIRSFCDKHVNTRLFDSLGNKVYLSMLANCEMLIGNSSSGILEAPFFRVPTINIGDRQGGRIQPESVINCPLKKNAISLAIKKARCSEFKSILKTFPQVYGDGNVSEKVHTIIRRYLFELTISLKKEFFDIGSIT